MDKIFVKKKQRRKQDFPVKRLRRKQKSLQKMSRRQDFFGLNPNGYFVLLM